MMDALLLIATVFAVLCSLGSLACAILFFVNLRIPTEAPQVRVAVILPATGKLPGLEHLLDDLARQRLCPHRLIVAVESHLDPAYERVCSLLDRHRSFALDIVVAGLADRGGQKCANLIAAVKELTPEDVYILLIDADIRPQPWFISGLVAPLAVDRADIVNGYRWLTPVGDGVAATMIAALDRRNAVLPRLKRDMIWGGCIAMTARALAALDLPTILKSHISDDLPIGERAFGVGLRVLAPRAFRAPTPLEGDFRSVFAFARRQVQMLRLYRPGLWSYAACVMIGELGARLWLVMEAATNGGRFLTALLALIVVAALDTSGARLRLSAGNRIGVTDTPISRALHHAFALTLLPLPICVTALFLASAVVHRVTWAHIRYQVDGSGQVIRLERDRRAKGRAAE